MSVRSEHQRNIEFRPIFVVGHPRSGTTLLASILSRNSQIAGTPETHFLNEFSFQLERLVPGNPSKIAENLAKTRIKHFHLDRRQLETRLSAEAPSHVKSVFRCVLEAYAEKRKKRIVLEKTPVHIRHIEDLLDWYPKARIVWIVRDGRASIASLLKQSWASDDLRLLARQWVRNIAFGFRGERSFPDSMFRLRYEDLLANPRPTLEALHAWLGIAFENEELEPNADAFEIPSFERPWIGKALLELDPSRVNAWKSTLSTQQIEDASRIMAESLQELGYDPELPNEFPTSIQYRFQQIFNRLRYSDLSLTIIMLMYKARHRYGRRLAFPRNSSSRSL